jgi:hypothetical protein
MKTKGPNDNTPRAERLGEELIGDAAIGGSPDDVYEPIIPEEVEEIGAEDESLD